jgi:hypothetical protein
MNGYVFRHYWDPLDPRKGGAMVAMVAENEADAHVLAWQSFDYQRGSEGFTPDQLHLVSTSTDPACLLWSWA